MTTRSRFASVACVSLALHAAVFALLSRVPASLRAERERTPGAAIWLELEAAPNEAPSQALPITGRDDRAHDSRPPSPAHDRAQVRAAAIAPAPPSAPESKSPAEPARAPEPVASIAPLPAIDPRHVALGARLDARDALSDRSSRDPNSATERGAELSAYLKAYANARPFAKRPPPALRRDANGTCHYDGDAIVATILPDAGVVFEDKPPRVEPKYGVDEPPARPTTPEDQTAPPMLQWRAKVSGRAWDAEREWFLRETTALRRELADAAHARDLVASDRELTKQLDRVWCDASRPLEARKRALFELWNETSPDELGRRGRRVILAYVRANVRKDGPFAFRREELAQLNARRAQRELFAPYESYAGAADAGVQ